MKQTPKELAHDFFLMSVGTALVSVGVYFFKFPNNFSMGGVSGMAVLLGKLIPQLSPSTFNSIINLLFLVLGFLLLDKGFGFRTVYLSLIHILLASSQVESSAMLYLMTQSTLMPCSASFSLASSVERMKL